jgi:hypothetical protein
LILLPRIGIPPPEDYSFLPYHGRLPKAKSNYTLSVMTEALISGFGCVIRLLYVLKRAIVQSRQVLSPVFATRILRPLMETLLLAAGKFKGIGAGIKSPIHMLSFLAGRDRL